MNHPLSFTSLAQWLGIPRASERFTWRIVSTMPLLPIANQQSTENTLASLIVQATDAISSASLTYSAANLPHLLSINASTGVISGTISRGDSVQGTFFPTITAPPTAPPAFPRSLPGASPPTSS